MNFLSAAMDVLPFGWKVFPVAPGGKLPAIPKSQGGNGHKDATDDEAIIEGWAQKYPRANLGLACGAASGILVVDIDVSHGGLASLRDLKERGYTLPQTVSVRTPSGGWHGYYRYGHGLRNSQSLLGPGIDIRAEGGYVVAPPSRLSGGKCYSWHRAPLGADLPVLPAWAAEKLKPRERTPFYHEPFEGEPGDIGGLIWYLERAPSGERNAILFWCACRAGESVMRGELAEADAAAQLTTAAKAVGLEGGETQRSIRSGLRRGKR